MPRWKPKATCRKWPVWRPSLRSGSCLPCPPAIPAWGYPSAAGGGVTSLSLPALAPRASPLLTVGVGGCRCSVPGPPDTRLATRSRKPPWLWTLWVGPAPVAEPNQGAAEPPRVAHDPLRLRPPDRDRRFGEHALSRLSGATRVDAL